MTEYETSLAEWQEKGYACKQCGDLELIEPDEGVANGPLVNGLCVNCVEDNRHEGHVIRMEYPATEIHLGVVAGPQQMDVEAASQAFELRDDASPRLFCVTCSQAKYAWDDGVEVTPDEIGLEGCWDMNMVSYAPFRTR